MKQCVFCEKYKIGKNIIYETDLFFARWEEIPLTLGHALVVSKRHVQYFDDLKDDEKAELMLMVGIVVKKIREANLKSIYEGLIVHATERVKPYLEKALVESEKLISPPDAFNHGLNDGPAAGQSIPHFHYHLIPRRRGDVENARGGIRRMLGKDEYSDS